MLGATSGSVLGSCYQRYLGLIPSATLGDTLILGKELRPPAYKANAQSTEFVLPIFSHISVAGCSAHLHLPYSVPLSDSLVPALP